MMLSIEATENNDTHCINTMTVFVKRVNTNDINKYISLLIRIYALPSDMLLGSVSLSQTYPECNWHITENNDSFSL